jgi:putative transposase
MLCVNPYSSDLRERVLAIPHDVPSVEVGERFGVSGSFVRKLRQRFHATGVVAAMPFPGRARIVNAEAEDCLRALVVAQPDATLLELCDKLEEQTGLAVSEATMSRQMQRMGITRKKKC